MILLTKTNLNNLDHGRLINPNILEAETKVTVEKTPVDEGVTVVNSVSSQEQVTKTVSNEEACTSIERLSLDPMITDTSIASFMSRDFVIAEFNWLQTDLDGLAKKSLMLPYELLSKKVLLNKASKYQYLRCDFVVNIKVTGSQFHYGRLLMTYDPCPLGNAGIDEDAGRCNLISASAQPHVQISPNGVASMDLVVPFSLPLQYIDLSENKSAANTEANTCAIVVVWILNMLRSSTTGSLPVTVRARMINVVLTGPTCEDWTITAPNYVNYPAPNLPVSSNIGALFTQGTKNTVDPEQDEKSQEGVISGVAERVAQFAEPFTHIPLVGEIASAVATGACGIAGIAKSLGYSMPNDMRASMPTYVDNAIYPHSTGIELSRIVAFKPDCKTSPSLPQISGFTDEMQISRIISTPAIMGRFNILPSHGVNYELYRDWITPLAVLGTVTTDTSTPPIQYAKMWHTPLSYTSMAFTKWRGSINFRLQIIASAMHSGSIRISWVPNNNSFNNAWPNSADTYADIISKVVEIKGTTEVCFSIPYMKPEQWSSISYQKNTIIESNNLKAYQMSFNGNLFISVVTPLTHMMDPVPTVSCNLWHSAGADFQLAGPTRRRLKVRRLQGGTEAITTNDLRSGGYSSHSMRRASYEPLVPSIGYRDNNCCDGDTVTCLKKLLSVPELTAVWKGIMNDKPILLNPYAPPGLTNDANVQLSYFDWFSNLFRWARGGLSVRVQSDYKSDLVAFFTVSTRKKPPRRVTNLPQYSLADSVDVSTPQITIYGDSQTNPYRATFPYSSTIPATRLFHSCTNGNFDTSVGIRDLPVIIIYHTSTSTVETTRLYTHVADDFEMSQMLGPPTVETEFKLFLSPMSTITY